MRPDVVIAGGGLAGLSAAVELSRRGLRVVLLEQRPRPGGRTWSFSDERTGQSIDNGQHLLMGCYAETRRYLSTIGTAHLASLQPSLRIPFLRPGAPQIELRCPPLPAPLHVLAGALQLTSLSLGERIGFLRVGMSLLTLGDTKRRRLETLTVDAWLRSLGQSERARMHLWDIIAVGSLNDDPSVVAALPFFRVLRTAFFGRRTNASLLVPRTGLSELLVDPAVAYIARHGGTVRCNSSAAGVGITGGRATELRLEHSESIAADAFIIAVPWHEIGRLLPSSRAARAAQLSSAPIITVYLHLDKPVTQEPLGAMIGTRMQWVFNRSSFLPHSTDGQTLALLASGAHPLVTLSADELVRIALEDLRAVLPEARSAVVRGARVIKEKRATFSPRPGSEELRPGATTEVGNLFLAGDWTDTGYPATIEGAVLSGHRAAEAALAYLRRTRR